MNVNQTEVLAILLQLKEDISEGCDIAESLEDARLAVRELFTSREQRTI